MEPSPIAGNESPPGRSTILPSFLRRPRLVPPQPVSTALNRDPLFLLDELPTAISPGTTQSPTHRRRNPTNGSNGMQPSVSATTPSGPSLGLGHMLRRRRSAGTVTPHLTAAALNTHEVSPASASNRSHRIRLVPHLDSRRSLKFEPISRDLKEGDPALRIGRFTDRSGLNLAAVNSSNSNKLAFKSKVVSRAHAEIWVGEGGTFMIRDTKSSSGTFLNHMRLSPAGKESKPFSLKDGDVLQLGVDYQGGTEDIYKSVKIRVELGREWQASANVFNTNAMKTLKTLAASNAPESHAAPKQAPKSGIPDCCICLFTVTIRQALFIAPCSHTFHYKCIKPLLDTHHPAFSCPLCRTFADLDEDVEVEFMDLDAILDATTEKENGNEQEGGKRDANADGTPIAHATPLPTLSLPPQSPSLGVSERERDTGAETEVEPDGVVSNNNDNANENGNGLHPYIPRPRVQSRQEGESSWPRHSSEGESFMDIAMDGQSQGHEYGNAQGPDRTSASFGFAPGIIRTPLGWEDTDMDVDGLQGGEEGMVAVDVVRLGHGGESSSRTSADDGEGSRAPEMGGVEGEDEGEGGTKRKRLSFPLQSIP